jgi:CubicO group peptidase (beta-lactamase class C family)
MVNPMNLDSHMDPDSFQKAWHSQSSQTRVTIAADLLLKEMQRSQRSFRATIFYRDFREIAVGLLMLPSWFYLGHRFTLPWTWYLGIPAITWVILFIVVDRFRHKQRPRESGEPLVDCAKASRTQVEHQIWLLRNVFWWYLLPFTIAILAFFAQTAWLRHSGFWPITFALLPFVLFLLVLYGFVYYLNQRAVRRDLEPRREELLTLLATLGDETTDGPAPATERQSITNSGTLGQALLVTSLTAVVVALMFLADSMIPYPDYRPFPTGRGTPAPFAHLITDLRREKKLVGLAAVVTVDGKVEASAVDGERKWASGVPLELDDRWHLGGISTSVTASTIARLIESGQLQWSTTVGECFPDAPIHEDWKSVTFQELLTQTSGAPPNFSPDVNLQRPALGRECTLARRDAALDVLANKPDYPPGEKYAYSNVGPTIAAAMVEEKTGDTWEDLVKREVFEPLALTSAGFGPPKSPDETLPQPRGHFPYLGAKIPVSDVADNSPIMGPAGSVCMTLADLSTYATEHLRGHLGKGKLLSAETYQRLHTPRLHDYAYGWGVKERGANTPHAIYWHNGSNTYWYALVVFIPEKNMVVAVASNDGDFPSAEAAAWEIVSDAANDLQFSAPGYAKKSPFAAVRWQESQPEVQVDDDWFKLVSLDTIPTADIIAFSQKTYGDKWQKRFEEDLVELLSRMGHPPGDTVSLVVESLSSPPDTSTLEAVPMTEANRDAIRAAAESRP